MSKTLNDYLVLLKPKYQEYIVHCVKEHGNRPDFHRGLLPFLPADEAARALRHKLEDVKTGAVPAIPGETPTAIIGEKFIRGIIGVFEDALVHKLYEDEHTECLHLSDAKIYEVYQNRIRDGKFIIRLALGGRLPKFELLAELSWASKNRWNVTAKKGNFEEIALNLADVYGSRS